MPISKNVYTRQWIYSVRKPCRRTALSWNEFCSFELYDQGLIEARSVEQTEVFKAAEQFARIEGILPAPESSHAIKVAIDEALKCKETGEERILYSDLQVQATSICLHISVTTTMKCQITFRQTKNCKSHCLPFL